VPDPGPPAECVINISEGDNGEVLGAICRAGADWLLDLHSDPQHNRSVLTLGGPLEEVEDAARRVVATAVARVDLRSHVGVHPRMGVADVVPFVPLTGAGPDDGPWTQVVEARNRFARWAGHDLGVPCFLYGPERTLPELRRQAFNPLPPDTGPPRPHPTAGASAVGARPVMVAYNVWISDPRRPDPGETDDPVLSVARSIAAELRGPAVRSLGLEVDAGAQVSFNLIDPASVSVAAVYDAVAERAQARGCSVLRGELVGLAPQAMLRAIPTHRWPELDLSEDTTIECRMADRGLSTI
jgi:glutamate formiminotransferase / 5-formyltetrahydrofolate cyclo-ligase